MSDMVARIPDVIDALMAISVRYPDEEIVVRIQAGVVKVGFVKGDYGDQQHNAWLVATRAN